MNTIDALSVDVERNDNLKKVKFENGFYNIVDGEKISTSQRLSVINPATWKATRRRPCWARTAAIQSNHQGDISWLSTLLALMRVCQMPNTVLVLSSLIFCHSLMAQGFLPLPENSAIVSAVAGEGVQIYESKPNRSGGFQWSLKAPEADLKGLSGEILGKHGAGPSWTMDDGSSIVGNLPPLEAVVAPKGVPWLLVSVKSKSGSGILNQVDYVVRVAADGGVAPAEPPKTGGETVRVRYRAIYLFLHKMVGKGTVVARNFRRDRVKQSTFQPRGGEVRFMFSVITPQEGAPV